MKILVTAPHPFFQNRGTPIAVRMLLETLAAAGHTITLLTFPEGEDVEIKGVKIKRLCKLGWVGPVKPGFSRQKLVYDFLLFLVMARILRHEKFDLIHSVEESAFLAAWFGHWHNIPFVYDMDSSLSHQLGEKFSWLAPLMGFFHFMEKQVVKRAVGVLPVCAAIEERVKKYDPDVLCRRLEDVTLLSDDDGELPGRANLHLSADNCHLMYVGNLESYQGIDLLLEGFRLALMRQELIRLVIIGGSELDILKYEEQARKMGIGEQTFFVGPRPVADLHYYLQQADILVSPRSKGFNTPMKIYSYLDSGRVVLATRIATHTQVLDDAIAYLVEATGTSFADGICCLAEDEGLRKRLAKEAEIRVATEYTPKAFAQKLNGFYKLVEERIAS